jgi:FixJ family two-component response regulator
VTDTVLFVDDEPAILATFVRQFRYAALRRERAALPPFDVRTALGAEAAFEVLREPGNVAVIVADLRMPGMDGVRFLEEARGLAPDAVRMMLTGQADMTTAVDAINRGAIFRFLTKPCEHQALAAAVDAALEQHRLVRAERQLLDQTLAGAIQVLTEVLALVNPSAASRALRIRRIVTHVVRRLEIPAAWEFEVAALLSQLGHLAMGLDAPDGGRVTSLDAHLRLQAHPAAACDLLSSIPRLEGVSAIVGAQQDAPDPHDVRLPLPERPRVRLGGQLLCVAAAFDARLCTGLSSDEALDRLRLKPSQYDPVIVEALTDLELPAVAYIPRRVPIGELRSGMLLDQDVRNESGLLLIAKGAEVTLPVLIRLKTLVASGAIETQVRVLARGE